MTRAVVVDTSQSPHARLRPVPVDAVAIEDAFWAPRLRTNREATLPSQLALLWQTGRIDNLRRAAGEEIAAFRGRVFNDSDVYKWLEAASWSLATHPDAKLARSVDEVIGVVERAQRPDGYLNSYFARERAGERWADFDQHEMYCAGHLFQAAVAHHRATGSPRLLDVAIHFADHLDAVFGPQAAGKRVATDGHPEVEMALVELARETGEQRYVDLATFFLDVRGHGILGDAFGRFGSAYHQDHQPFRALDEIVGHAVRAVYLNAGATDLYVETGEPALRDALRRLWGSMTARKLYVSGGIGSRYEGESFGEDFELPNALAYTETCAAIGSVMWNWRMLLAEGDARYADLIERTLYNAILPGVSLDGATYFYQNPLADEGTHRRQAWFGTACCPPNVARTLASLPGYVYTVADDELWVHLYMAGTARIPLPDGRVVALRQATDYPWDGAVAIEVDGEGEFALKLRIPAWCEQGATLAVNGEQIAAPLGPGTYAELRRIWQPGDVVHLTLPMPVRRVESHPAVEENLGRVALMRGPLLYCLEQADNPEVDLRQVVLPDDATIDAAFRSDLLGGVVALTAEAISVSPDPEWPGRLYRATEPSPQTPLPPQWERGFRPPSPGSTGEGGRGVRADTGERADAGESEATIRIPCESEDRSSRHSPVAVTAIPYHTWANRAPGAMRVWLRRVAASAT